ncbi:SDR family NAD(P)-dependent oxidoreductase [Catenulispora pinisilvae]|uniref:SDR family NAD(P)-dependent oxidoreductase n=1 Tax=Catenulispora pinisilvae TaxID=2705253 RepID=UPI001E398E77|nr:SDR family NAD(P)-dependent oxidoreductase [Catenulispora pinisilvae]
MVATTQQGRFVGKAAVVTGGSRDIGTAVARRLAAEGAAVAIGYRGNQEAADALAAELAAMGGQAIAVQADVADPGQTAALIERTVAEFGHLDVVASCAGVEHFGAPASSTSARWRRSRRPTSTGSAR